MFNEARREAAVDTDLIPYWIYEGSVRVERSVPMLPFSREVTRIAWLKRSLTVYRPAFGKTRQDDLLEYIQICFGVGKGVGDQIEKASWRERGGRKERITGV